jgi:hypothetical protein
VKSASGRRGGSGPDGGHGTGEGEHVQEDVHDAIQHPTTQLT